MGNSIYPYESKQSGRLTLIEPGMLAMGLSLSKSRVGKTVSIAAGTLLLLIAVAAILLHHFWPFTEEAVRRELGEAASANVTFQHFENKYFPPGCVAEGVVFQRNPTAQPLIVVKRLTIRSNLFALLRHRVSLIRAEGTRANWQKVESRPSPHSRPTVVDRLVADDAVLEIPRNSPDGPLWFVFHKFEVKDLRGPGQSSFAAEFENPLPKGMISVSGHFGPWNSSTPEKTALKGDYALVHADLGVFHSIAGLLSSKGRFSGTFDNLNVQGQASTPELAVSSTHHGLPLQAEFVANVNGATADVTLTRVKAQFGKDELDAGGTIARGQDGRRVASLQIDCDRGRIEDTFYPFIHSPQAAITGAVRFRMHVTIPPGPEPFKKRLSLSSVFDIEGARFTHEQTQVKLSKISEAPDQQRPDTLAPTSFRGQVSLQDGVARFSELRVNDQNATAVLRGQFGIVDQRVNMHGDLKTAASLAKATEGIKAVFAKVIEPFFKKKPHETVVPIKIGGTYSHPQFGLDIGRKM